MSRILDIYSSGGAKEYISSMSLLNRKNAGAWNAARSDDEDSYSSAT